MKLFHLIALQREQDTIQELTDQIKSIYPSTFSELPDNMQSQCHRKTHDVNADTWWQKYIQECLAMHIDTQTTACSLSERTYLLYHTTHLTHSQLTHTYTLLTFSHTLISQNTHLTQLISHHLTQIISLSHTHSLTQLISHHLTLTKKQQSPESQSAAPAMQK